MYDKKGEKYWWFHILVSYFVHVHVLYMFISYRQVSCFVHVHICICFHVLYMFMFCTCLSQYVGFMFCTCSYMYMFSCFVLNKIEHHLRGSFYLPLIFCFIDFMFCHHQKGGDCWPKGYTLHLYTFVLMITNHIKLFGTNKDSRMNFKFVPVLMALYFYKHVVKLMALKACCQVDGARGLFYRRGGSNSATRFRNTFLYSFIFVSLLNDSIQC